ncbi:type II CRISPR RNA-guided endonuclease Cas9 [Polaromonas sp.]|uniref:type II CRISPR RNA-guided endonuclease Cas9 n=1 Tax=Polaromonas sp. TaxID=1869339 RepID=UPI003264E07A
MNHNAVAKIYRDRSQEPLTFGFDIGMASVGWAVLNETRIVALGVRAFDKAETAKEGESLNLARRSARLMRRRLRRRAWRLTKLARLLRRFDLIADAEYFRKQPSHTDSTWELRRAGLDRVLGKQEWARVIFHLCKHRGFHWISRAEEKAAEADSKGEGGRVKQGLAGTAKLMSEKGYRTAAEMVLAEFPQAQRNKHGEYSKALSRVLLADEMQQLFEAQRRLKNLHATADLQTQILGNGDRKNGLFWAQKPALAGKDLLKMLGHCTFEKAEYRAPKASFTAERHVWLTRLNNVRITASGKSRPLTADEHRICLLLPYHSAEKFTYKNVRAALVKAGLDASFRFTGFSYPSEKQIGEKKAKNPEEQVMVKLAAWHELRLTLKKHGLEDAWQQMSVQALDGDPDLLDQIAWVLSVYKEDDEVRVELNSLDLPGGAKTVEALLDIRFDKFHALSLNALRKIVPYMQSGMRYDEACAAAGYHHSQLHGVGKGKHRTLPSLYSSRDKDGRMVFDVDLDVPRNPVVLRAVNQARKVLNALVKTYGSPTRVHIELARDLSRPFDERRDIKKEQEDFRDRNEKDKAEFASHFHISGNPRGGDFEKWRLYREQQGKCAYSLRAITLERLLEPGYVEVDHALPYSRSFDDSKNNRVLVFAKENRDKGNLTPYEYLDGINESQRWREFVAFVETNKAWRQAKRSRLLRRDFGQEEAQGFRDRNLNDTRYIAKFFKNYVERSLKLVEGSDSQRCVVLSGQLTAFLRARWGLLKIREESDRHHALDAVVIAACSHSMVKRMSDYSRRKELAQVREGFVDMETGEIVNAAAFAQLEAHFPSPWPGFRDELHWRLKIDDVTVLRSEIQRLGTYPPEALDVLRPLFVSRAPQRRNSGAVHKETIYAQPNRLRAQGGVTQKVAVGSLTLKDVEKLVEPHRNEKLYAAIRKWLETRDANEKRAKEIEAGAGRGKDKRPLTTAEKLEIEALRALPRKPGKDDTPGPIVRTVTLEIDKLSGIPIRGGIAKNDTMLRVDVFTKAGKFHLVPVYVHHKVTGLPNRAVVAFKDEAEWTLIDDSFGFCFSLYPNDFVHVSQKGKPPIQGYYSACDRSTGTLTFWAHDRNESAGKDGLIRSVGVKTAISIGKFDIDVLGNAYPSRPEQRHGLA